MIVPFVVDPNALVENSDVSHHADLAKCERIIELWRDHGVLILPGPSSEKNELLRVVGQLPVRFRNRWQKALKKQRLKGIGGIDASHLLASLQTVSGLSSKCEVICVSDTVASHFLLPNDRQSSEPAGTNLEISRYGSFDLSEKLKKARELSTARIIAGTATQQVWQERFALITSMSRHITVVDRYSLENCYRYGSASGLSTLLNSLAVDQAKHSVTVLAASFDIPESDLGNAVKALRSNWGGVQSLEIYVIPDTRYRRLQHDRYIRCDDTVLEIGTGLEVLQHASVIRGSNFSSKREGNFYKPTEEILKSAVSSPSRIL